MPIKPKAGSKQQSAGVGLRPENFVEGGGLFDDFDGTILEMLFVEWDYDGKYDPSFFLAVEIRNDEEEEAGEEAGAKMNPFVQHYSAGDLGDFTPSADGKEAVPVGSKTGLSKSTNAYAFLMSILDVGLVDPESVGNSVEAFEGISAHFKRQDQPDRKGLKKERKEGDRKPQILLAEGPVAAAAAPKKGTVAKKPNPVGSTAGSKTTNNKAKPAIGKAKAGAGHGVSDEIVEAAYVYLDSQIEAGGGSAERDTLAKGVFKWAKDSGLDVAERNAVLQAVGNEDFLSTENDHFEFDGATLTGK